MIHFCSMNEITVGKVGIPMLAPSHPLEYSWTIREIVDLFERRSQWVSTTLNQALAEDADERWKWVLDRYLDQRISLSKTAELLGMHALELRERFLQLSIPLRIDPADLADAKAEVESIRRWFDAVPQLPST